MHNENLVHSNSKVADKVFLAALTFIVLIEIPAIIYTGCELTAVWMNGPSMSLGITFVCLYLSLLIVYAAVYLKW